MMRRTQLNLDEWQYEALLSRSERQGRSVSDLVREAVAEYLTRKPRKSAGSLRDIEGVAEDPHLGGKDHDRYLYRRARTR